MTDQRAPWQSPIDGTPDEWLAWANALPMSRDLNMVCTGIDRGRATYSVASSPLTPNPNGSINGGVVAAIADQAMGAVTMTVISPGQVVATASFHAQFQRPAMPPLTVRAHATKTGRTLVFVDVVVEDADGRLTNTAQGTMMAVPLGGYLRERTADAENDGAPS
ncbi:hypothetical protein DSM112329_04253 [Paraconexibacter sp. AEG42_29]|uniref:Thioesterase domain-containing protein n=1 Tax=Paraconexibacter sp. AEG42_29 TaxID=2997339 RepID=A0AAU7B162_9ACTN